MASNSSDAIINLIAVIVTVTDDSPRVLIVEQNTVRHAARNPEADDNSRVTTSRALPNGPFEPRQHVGLESGLRCLVEEQTGIDLYYVEQLYTFGNRFRDPSEIDGGPRVVSVAYIALAHEEISDSQAAQWHDWYDFLPWEDWRTDRPAVMTNDIEPSLVRWVRNARAQENKRQRQERVNVTFGRGLASDMDAVLCLERYELLYEAGLVSEADRDANAANRNSDPPMVSLPVAGLHALGTQLESDHRRILATALGRLRGKLAYRPVVFELLPGEFTLLQLQRVVEALSGAELHKQNFRRLVTNADLVEPIGRTSAVGRGRPAELFRFRREVLGEKLTVGLSRPVMRGGGDRSAHP